MSDAPGSVGDPQTSERRIHPRQQALFSCMQLQNDNGGIILNISEGGLAMDLVRSLTGDPLPQMRFQLSQSNGWVETRGRIVWTSGSKTTAGVQFVDLPDEASNRIKKWISSIVESNASVKRDAPVEDVAANRSPADLESRASFQEPRRGDASPRIKARS